MKVGYPCLTVDLPFQSVKTFRLASYTEDRLRECVAYNFDAVRRILEYNREEGILLFRLSSDLVPFGSHPVNQYPWQQEFAPVLRELGQFVVSAGMRVSMHPDQFVLLNSPGDDIFRRSVAELAYQADVLDGMGLDLSHKLQIHVGGVYGDKEASLQRFIARFPLLPLKVRRRLVVENDDRLYHLDDCLRLYAACGTPVLFDVFHHKLNGNGLTVRQGMIAFAATWGAHHGLPLIDYSSQEEDCRAGTHSSTLDAFDFRRFLSDVETVPFDFDIMLEIKDKENSALRALREVRRRGRLG